MLRPMGWTRKRRTWGTDLARWSFLHRPVGQGPWEKRWSSEAEKHWWIDMNGYKNRQVLRNLVKHSIFTLKIRQYRFLRVIVHQPVCKNIKNLGKNGICLKLTKRMSTSTDPKSEICWGLRCKTPPPIWSILQDKAQGMGKFLHAAGDWSLDAIH